MVKGGIVIIAFIEGKVTISFAIHWAKAIGVRERAKWVFVVIPLISTLIPFIPEVIFSSSTIFGLIISGNITFVDALVEKFTFKTVVGAVDDSVPSMVRVVVIGAIVGPVQFQR